VALTQSAQILLVTRRDPQDPVRRLLRGAGYAVVSADSPAAALRTAQRSHPALIVVDPRAPNTSGADALASFAETYQIPVVRGWAGSDALLAEVERVLGPLETAGREPAHLLAGPLEVDFAGHSARVSGSPLDLTAREFDLLSHLARHPGWVWSRQELLEHVWGYEFGDPRVVTVHMANLRKKLDATAPGCELIETVRNVGYKFVVAGASHPAQPVTPLATVEGPLVPRRRMGAPNRHASVAAELCQCRERD
jgi:DNA-binding response OmpR family regulator